VLALGGVRSADAQSDVWTSIGPEGTTYIRALVVDAQNPSTVYAGSYYEGRVYKRTDSESGWIDVNLASTNKGAFTLAIDPLVPTTLYASSAASVFKSSDGGSSWNTAGLGGYVYTMAIDPQISSTLYAGTWYFDGYVFKSTDGGATWSRLDLTIVEGGILALAIDPLAPTTIYAGTTRGLFKSTDAGTSWSVTGLANGGIYALAIDPQSSSTVYASWTDHDYTPRRIFKSTDGGASWTSSYSGLPDIRLVSALVIDPQDPATLHAGASNGGGIFRSTDGGANWTAMNDGLTNLSVSALAIDPQTPTILYAGTEGSGVFAIQMTPRFMLSTPVRAQPPLVPRR